MAWVIDTCVLLDIALNDPAWGIQSAKWLESKRSDGLVVCPVSVIEITPQFGGEIEEVRKYLSMLGIRDEPDWIYADTRAASCAWSAYVTQKRIGTVAKRPLADLMIGAFATRFTGLITRNPGHFRPWFPDLTLPDPE